MSCVNTAFVYTLEAFTLEVLRVGAVMLELLKFTVYMFERRLLDVPM